MAGHWDAEAEEGVEAAAALEAVVEAAAFVEAAAGVSAVESAEGEELAEVDLAGVDDSTAVPAVAESAEDREAVWEAEIDLPSSRLAAILLEIDRTSAAPEREIDPELENGLVSATDQGSARDRVLAIDPESVSGRESATDSQTGATDSITATTESIIEMIGSTTDTTIGETSTTIGTTGPGTVIGDMVPATGISTPGRHGASPPRPLV